MTILNQLKENTRDVSFVKTLDRPLAPFHTDLTVLPVTRVDLYKKVILEPFAYKNEVCISGAFYDDLQFLAEEKEIIRQKNVNNYDYLHERAAAAEKMGDILIANCQAMQQRAKTVVSPADRLAMIQQYIRNAEQFIPWFTFTITAGIYLEEKIEQELAHYFSDPQQIKMGTFTLTTPIRPNLLVLEQQAFLKLATKYRRGETAESLLDHHLQAFGFIGMRTGGGSFWTIADLQQRLDQCTDPQQEYVKQQTEMKTRAAEVAQLLKKIHPTDAFLDLIAVAQQYVWLRTYRSDIYSRSFAMMSTLMDAYVISQGYESGDYLAFTLDDYLNNRKPSAAELTNRKTSFAAICIEGKITYLSGSDSLAFQQFLDAKQDLGQQVKGNVASKPVAKVTGRARLIASSADFNKVKLGDIVVATMTTPDFVPIMKVAAGFVTDEGGILCHAAIISRELNKPCIVGTQNATKVIKDGDQIEMDLETGNVSIL